MDGGDFFYLPLYRFLVNRLWAFIPSVRSDFMSFPKTAHIWILRPISSYSKVL